ncbi:DUF300-domain-containing protein [Fomitopsis betulina]|nr:DUF300-domain-containing protein [Fomitopsis betulina]
MSNDNNIANGRCWAEVAEAEPSLTSDGRLATHTIGWIVSGAFSIVAVLTSAWLLWQHMSWYTNKREQRYIVRILLMVPIYAAISFGSYLYWNHSTALLLIRDCYESIVLTSFFYLLLNYISHDTEEQKEVFRRVGLSKEYDRNARRRGTPPSHWMFPLQFIKWKPEDGFYFLQLMKWGVLQYCVIRPTTTLAAVILNWVGLYCEDSWGPGWGHIYITVIMSISVTIAMYCLIQLYMPVSEQLAPHKPILKLFAVKAVVFLTFWQATLISILETFGLIKDTEYMTADNVATGLGAIIECVEMALFALIHIKAYTYIVYRDPATPRLSRFRALVHALNFKETAVELWRGCVYMVHRARGRETDRTVRRGAAFERLFGTHRWDLARGDGKGASVGEKGKDDSRGPIGVGMEVEEVMHVGDERQWLGLGDQYAYGIGYHSRRLREKSDGLEEQIKKELNTRGYRKRVLVSLKDGAGLGEYAPIGQNDPPPARPAARTRVWWRDVYARISRTSADHDPDPEQDGQEHTKSFKRVHGYHAPQMSLDDPPPRSAIKEYRDSQRSRKLPPMLDAFVDLDPLPSPPIPLSPLSIPLLNSPPRASPPRGVVRRLSAQFESLHFTDSQDSRGTAGQNPLPRAPSSTRSPHDSDSFLGRAFTNLPEPTTSVEQLSTGPSSSQSHRTQVRLCAEPAILPYVLNKVRIPQLEAPPSTPAKAASPIVTSSAMMRHMAARAPRRAPALQGVPEDPMAQPDSTETSRQGGWLARRMSSPPGRLAPPRARRSSHPDEPRRQSLGGPVVQPISPSSPLAPAGRVTRYTPRGMPIVLPAPLAPTGLGSVFPPVSPPRVFSAPGSRGSPLDTEYLRRDMS